ncbi:MAG: hypothetical protein ACLPY2_00905 [Bryobacteraceae bacterium]|jgi:hypothetical protein
MPAILFPENFRSNEGKCQVVGKEMPSGMTYTIANLADVIIAAKAHNSDIAVAVGDNPPIVDLAAPFSTALKTTGLLVLAKPLPHNPDYHQAVGRKSEALKDKSAWHIEVVDSVHMSLSCTDPHLSIYIKTNAGTARGPKIHICVIANGAAWAFDKIHQ